MYVIELGQLERQPAGGAPVSQAAEPPGPGAVRDAFVPAPAGDTLVPVQAGPPAGEVRPGGAERPVAAQARVSAVEAGFFRWDLTAGQVTLEPGTRWRHGLPAGGPVTVAARPR